MVSKWKGKRLSVTAREAETAAGAELLALLQSIASDGRFTEPELDELRRWLDEHNKAALPGVAFLLDTVTRVLADGRIDDVEWDELHDAVIRVLPPEERPQAEAARWRAHAQEDAQRERGREEARARAAGEWDFMVAGVAFEGRGRTIDDCLSPGDPVHLRRDPGNQFDANAVAVLTQSGQQIGFVPARLAREMAPLLDSGSACTAWCKKILLGARASIPVVVATIDRSASSAPSVRAPKPDISSSGGPRRRPLQPLPDQIPPPASSRRSGSYGMRLLLLVLILAAIGMALEISAH